MKRTRIWTAAWSLVSHLLCTQWALAADWSDALRYSSGDGAFSFRLGGRLHADIGNVDADDPDSDGFFKEFRRARLNVSGKLFDDWRYRYEYDFASDNDFRIKDAYIAYYGFDKVKIKLGNLQEPISLEEMTSSNTITFMERALLNALAPGYRLGLLVNTWGTDWSISGGWFEGTIRGREDDVDEGWGVAGRAVYSPLIGENQRIHVGVSAEYREPKSDNRVSFSSRPEIHLIDRRMISTGTLSRVDYTVTSGIELAGVWGPWSLQGEYLRTDVRRTGRPDQRFPGWYLYGSWFIAGGQRNYDPKDGAFDQVEPTGAYGAWEVAIRYSVLDLEDDPITGGKEENWTLGLNWYLDEHMRLMANWVHAEADPNRSGRKENIEAWMARFQYVF